MKGETFGCTLNGIYDEIVHWKKIYSKFPLERLEPRFYVNFPACCAYADQSALESVAMKGTMVTPALLLQKPYFRRIW